MDFVVIGAGISGAATAYELAKRGFSVTLLDRYGPAAMASGWTLAGVRQSGRHPAELPLARDAVAQWATLSEELGAETQYRQDGNLRLARTEAELPVIEALVAQQAAAGLDVVLLRGAALRERAPAIAEDVVAASFCATDGHADPIATVQAFVAAAQRHGATTRFGERALAVEVSDGRVTGVRTDQGVIATGGVILAAGIFGNELLNPLGLEVPLHVQMVTVLQSAPVAPVLRPVIGVANADCAGRQEVDGRFRATSGILPWHGRMEPGPKPAVLPTAASVGDVIRLFGAAIPAFRAAPIERIWSGLIDQTPDALPVLDHAPGVAGLVVGMGFSGHGFCLGPVTGRILADLATGNGPDLPIAPFRLERFATGEASRAAVTLHG